MLVTLNVPRIPRVEEGFWIMEIAISGIELVLDAHTSG